MMQQEKYLLIDRDGTLIQEPITKQVDSLDQLVFMPQVFSGLSLLKQAGYRFVMVSNQDGLGSDRFPQEAFQAPHEMMLTVLKSQGITFDAILICPHRASDHCACRKPQIGMMTDFLVKQHIDLKSSYVIGDRVSDLEFAANLNIQGIQIGQGTTPDWSSVAAHILYHPRIARLERKTQETEIKVQVRLEGTQTVLLIQALVFLIICYHN